MKKTEFIENVIKDRIINYEINNNDTSNMYEYEISQLHI